MTQNCPFDQTISDEMQLELGREESETKQLLQEVWGE